MDLISFENFSYLYPYTTEPALKRINLKIKKGTFYGIIGENGAGKSTLGNVMRGLIPEFHGGTTKGDCIILGESLDTVDLTAISAKIGFVFQNPFTQISGVKETVFEEIALGLENLGFDDETIISQVVKVAESLGITHLLQNNPTKLSGGQCQRVAFASILAMDSEILVIDEPTSQLDPAGTRNIFDIISKLKDAGKTIILMEHKIDLIAEHCDEVIVMSDGEIKYQGEAHEVLSNPDIVKAGATLPNVALFASEMKEAGKELQGKPITIDETLKLIKQREANHGH